MFARTAKPSPNCKKVVVGTTSAIKLQAVQAVFPGAQVIGVKTASGVPEQPCDNETLAGARNRMLAARQSIADADYYIGIENGIFTTDGCFIDKSVVVMSSTMGDEQIEYSKGVEFPCEFVKMAQTIGFDKITVGQVLFEQGIVNVKDDPHASLGDKISRQIFLQETITSALQKLNQQIPRVSQSKL